MCTIPSHKKGSRNGSYLIPLSGYRLHTGVHGEKVGVVAGDILTPPRERWGDVWMRVWDRARPQGFS